MHLQSQYLVDGDRQILAVSWIDNLAYLVSSRLMRDPCLKKDGWNLYFIAFLLL